MTPQRTPNRNGLEGTVRDFAFAWRALRRTPGFTFAAILSLALGIAITASTLAVVNAYLLRAMPYPGGDRIHHVSYAPPGPWEPRGITALDWTTLSDVVEDTIGSAGENLFVRQGR